MTMPTSAEIKAKCDALGEDGFKLWIVESFNFREQLQILLTLAEDLQTAVEADTQFIADKLGVSYAEAASYQAEASETVEGILDSLEPYLGTRG